MPVIKGLRFLFNISPSDEAESLDLCKVTALVR